jgi:hypothetical protein
MEHTGPRQSGSRTRALCHWRVAINWHMLKHPSVRHKCETLDIIRFREIIGSTGKTAVCRRRD